MEKKHLTFLIAGMFLSLTAGAAASGPVAWDDQASAELKAALHQMHEVWNQGDIKALKKLLAGDDVLITFELDPATHQPIKLSSRQELHAFVDGIVRDLDEQSAVSVLGHPQVACRATQSFGICTEECSVAFKLPGGVEERHRLWSTATAVRDADGWKWIQWHMSTAGPVEVYRDGKLVASK